jgi:hypothetical protein
LAPDGIDLKNLMRLVTGGDGPTNQVHDLIARVVEFDPFCRDVWEITRRDHQLVNNHRTRRWELAEELILFMNAGIGLAGVLGRGVAIFAIPMGRTAIRQRVVVFIDTGALGIIRIREFTQIKGARVVVVTLTGLGTTTGGGGAEAAVGLVVNEIRLAHIENTGVGRHAV